MNTLIVHRAPPRHTAPPPFPPRESYLFLSTPPSSFFSTDSQLQDSFSLLLDKFFTVSSNRTRGRMYYYQPSFDIKYIYIYISFIVDGKATFSPKSLRNPRFLRFEKRWPRPRFSLARGNEITLIQRFRTVRLFPSAGQWSVVSRLDFRFWPGDDAASRSCPRGVFHSPSTRGGSRLSQGGRGREGGNLRPGTVAPRN